MTLSDPVKRAARRLWNDRVCVLVLGVLIGVVFMLLVVLLSSCGAIDRWNKRQGQEEFLRQLTYRKDPRTGLCFAVREGVGGMAVVDGKHCERKKR